MAYMKDKKGRRLDSFEVQESATSLRVSAWHRKVREATVDTHVLFIGDSTGAGPTRWVRLMANKVAAAYPTHTVIYAPFDDPTKTYPAGNKVTVQTGTGPRTITLWNASLSGSAISYARDNVGTITSGFTPDVLFVNYGHNSPQLTDDYRAVHQETVQNYANRFTNAALVLMTQNPRAITDAGYADGQGKNQAIYQLAVNYGHDIVDINEAFRLYGDYATDLLHADGLHPSDSGGSPFWADRIWEAIKPSRVALPSGYQAASTRIWVPASQFVANQGTPALVNHFGIPAWELDAATTESVACVVDIPSAWDKQNIRAVFTTENGTAPNAVVWTGEHMYVGDIVGNGSSQNLGTYSVSGGATQSAQTTAGRTSQADLWARIGLGSSPVALRVGRNGAHASDTLAVDALFIGLMIERAY